jgi:asparagine synthase (glutamine-hydrolysing)
MCGIAGLIVKNGDTISLFDRFRTSSSLLSHRGPDNNGEYIFENLLLIHYRLSIIDLDSRSNQPFKSQTGQAVTVYNGEIYNFNDLKLKYNLFSQTTGDTEVMLESFIKEGHSIIEEWNGIFSIAILDIQSKKLHLIRDRFGVKPLYYYEDEEVFIFASEAKVIFNFIDKIEFNYQGLSEYFWFGNTISEKTSVTNVYKVKPATHLEIKLDFKSEIKENIFWEIKRTNSIIPSFDEAVTKTKNLLEDAVKRQLVSDVSLGVLLSGGIDSSAIVAYASKHLSLPLDTYTVEYDFNIGGKSEMANANIISKKFATNHHELFISSKDIIDIFDKLVCQFDEPFSEPGNIPMYLLAKECSKSQKVILQGDGGDEIFGGYRRYNLLANQDLWYLSLCLLKNIKLNNSFSERIQRLWHIFGKKDDALKMALLLTQDVVTKSPFSIISEKYISQFNDCNPFEQYFRMNEYFKNEPIVQRMLYLDTEILLPNTYLEKVDKTTMAFGLESRVPFLDNELVDYVTQLPWQYKLKNGNKKYLLKRSLSGLIPNAILNGPKTGFNVPYKHWLKTDLYEFARDRFEQLPNDSILNKNKLINLLIDHKSGKGNYGPLLWKALVFSHWRSIYSDKIFLNNEILI